MKKIFGIFAFLGAIGSWQMFESIDKMQVRIAKESRKLVCECFVRHGLNPSCDLLRPIPVKWGGFARIEGIETVYGRYGRDGIWVSTMAGQVGSGFWRATSDISRTLRHEYVHALADVSGMPRVGEHDKLMEDCEK